MPCFTVVTVLVMDREMALKTLLHFGLDEGRLNVAYGGGYNVSLDRTDVTRGAFKTEYGMRIVERDARKQYGSSVRVWRTTNRDTNEQIVCVKI